MRFVTRIPYDTRNNFENNLWSVFFRNVSAILCQQLEVETKPSQPNGGFHPKELGIL
jgi:hypothetical protein